MLTDLDTEIEPNHSHFGADFMELSPYFDHAASLERGFCNIFKCTRVLFLFSFLLYKDKMGEVTFNILSTKLSRMSAADVFIGNLKC